MVHPRTTVLRRLRDIQLGILAGLILLLGTMVSPATFDKPAAPTAAQIETLLRAALTSDQLYVPSLYRRAEIKEFELRGLDGGLAPKWHAEVELKFEFDNPPNPSIKGFQRQRQRRAVYRLIILQSGESLNLLLFTPVGRVHRLPADA